MDNILQRTFNFYSYTYEINKPHAVNLLVRFYFYIALSSYLQGSGELTLSMMKNYATDSRHLVLLKGYQLQGEDHTVSTTFTHNNSGVFSDDVSKLYSPEVTW